MNMDWPVGLGGICVVKKKKKFGENTIDKSGRMNEDT